jgi:hypothetical protein
MDRSSSYLALFPACYKHSLKRHTYTVGLYCKSEVQSYLYKSIQVLKEISGFKKKVILMKKYVLKISGTQQRLALET